MSHTSYDIEELDKIEQLRNRLINVMPPEMYADTSYLVRFLRARNKEVNAAENMLRKNIEWKKKYKIDTLSSWYKPPEVLKKYLSLNSIRACKDGSPIIYAKIGNTDMRGLLMCGKSRDGLYYIVNFFENEIKFLKEQSKKLNRPIDQWTVVIDYENFTLSTATHKPSVEMLAQIAILYERNYPEFLKQCFVINSSWYFQIMYTFVKPLLTGNTLKKIQIFGKDGWKEELLKHIDAEVLPAFLGGNRTDDDGNPMCNSFIVHGGRVPEKYYASKAKIQFALQPDVRQLVVHRLSKKHIELDVAEPDSVIEWEFEVKKWDIAFTLLYKENQDSNLELKEVVPKCKIDTEISTEVGLHKCEKAGIYYLEFDNCYSWIHQKEVYFRVKVVAPQCCNKPITEI